MSIIAADQANAQPPSQHSFEESVRATAQARQTGNLNEYLAGIAQMTKTARGKEDIQRTFDELKTAAGQLERLSETMEVSTFYLNAGYFYSRYAPAESDEAIRLFQKSLIVRKKLFGEWNVEVARCFLGLGYVHRYQRYDYLEAEINYEHALQILEHIQSTDEFTIASTYYNLATTNREQHDYEKAIAYAMKTLELAQRLPGDFLERTCSVVANIYRDMGLFEQAQVFYRRAIFLHSDRRSNPGILAMYYAGLGQSFMVQRKFQEAQENLRQANDLLKGNDPEDHLRRIVVLQKTSDLFRETRDSVGFINVTREVLGLNARKGHATSDTYEGIARFYHDRGAIDSTFVNCQRSLVAGTAGFSSMKFEDNPGLEQIGKSYYLHTVLTLKAKAWHDRFLKTGDIRSLDNLVECMALAERLFSLGRSLLDVEVSRWEFEASNYSIYEEAIAALCRLSSDSSAARAFYFFERSKAHSLRAAVASANIAKRTGVPDSLLAKLEGNKQSSFALQDALDKELGEGSDPQRIASLRNRIMENDRKIQRVRNIIEQYFPGFFKVEFSDTVASAAQIRRQAADEDAVLLEYFWGNQNIFALAITGKKIVLRKIGPTDSVRSHVTPLLVHLITGRTDPRLPEFESFRTHALRSYDVLVRPFDDMVSRARRIRVIPDGLISQLPFEVLIDKDHRSRGVRYNELDYLVRSHDIGYAYSASLLVGRERRNGKVSSVLGMGFSDSDSERGIRGTQTEMEKLAHLFESSRILLGPAATEGNFKKLAPDFDIIHLAIHGKGDPSKSYSASLFFMPGRDSVEDEELHAYELYGLKLKAALAVLTSCESGLGSNYQGEGMISMASAFSYAGCHNILMGLWKVADGASPQLMDNFYQELLDGKRIDVALSETKRKYLIQADELTADPRIWAPMVSYGDQMPVFASSKTAYYMSAAVVGSLLFLFFWFRRKP